MGKEFMIFSGDDGVDGGIENFDIKRFKFIFELDIN